MENQNFVGAYVGEFPEEWLVISTKLDCFNRKGKEGIPSFSVVCIGCM